MESLWNCVIQMGGIQVSSIISELLHKTITRFRSEQIWVHCELIHKPLTRKTNISMKKLPPHIFILCKDTPERSHQFRKIRIRFVWYRNLEIKMVFWIIDTLQNIIASRSWTCIIDKEDRGVSNLHFIFRMRISAQTLTKGSHQK